MSPEFIINLAVTVIGGAFVWWVNSRRDDSEALNKVIGDAEKRLKDGYTSECQHLKEEIEDVKERASACEERDRALQERIERLQSRTEERAERLATEMRDKNERLTEKAGVILGQLAGLRGKVSSLRRGKTDNDNGGEE